MADCFSAIALIAEQRICEAQERGEFENLAGSGRPLELEDLSQVPDELRMAYKILKNAGYVPEEIARRKEISRLADLLDECKDEKERLTVIQKLRILLDRAQIGARRHAALEANDAYYNKILAKLQRQQNNTT